jgi:hypothetical protein
MGFFSGYSGFLPQAMSIGWVGFIDMNHIRYQVELRSSQFSLAPTYTLTIETPVTDVPPAVYGSTIVFKMSRK